MENKGTNEKKSGSIIYVAIALQKEAVKAIISGELTRTEAAEMYGVSHQSIIRWMQKAKAGFPKRAKKRSDGEWRIIVQEIKAGLLSVEDAGHQYGIQCQDTLRKWIRKSESDIAVAKQQTQENKMGSSGIFDEENQKLKQQLDQAQIKILALETLIEVASEEYGDDLRKKFGSKQ